MFRLHTELRERVLVQRRVAPGLILIGLYVLSLLVLRTAAKGRAVLDETTRSEQKVAEADQDYHAFMLRHYSRYAHGQVVNFRR
jgi:hypothetical protein